MGFLKAFENWRDELSRELSRTRSTSIPHPLASRADFKTGVAEGVLQPHLWITLHSQLQGPPLRCPPHGVYPPGLLSFPAASCASVLWNLIHRQCYFLSLWCPSQSLVCRSDQVSPLGWHLSVLHSFVLPHSASFSVSAISASISIHPPTTPTLIPLGVYFRISHWNSFSSASLFLLLFLCPPFLNTYWIDGWVERMEVCLNAR